MEWMLLTLLLHINPGVAPTTPPTIITTESSPLCSSVRAVIAPAIAGMVSQDRIINAGHSLMADMDAAEGAGFTMDNIHLGTVVYQLAKNNIAIHQTLDRLGTLKLSDPREVAEIARLHARLQAIADAQAMSLNVMSGIAASNDLADIASAGKAAIAALAPSPGMAPRTGPLEPSVYPGMLWRVIARDAWLTRSSESALLPALTPVINRCR
jgi:hypothetical protein